MKSMLVDSHVYEPGKLKAMTSAAEDHMSILQSEAHPSFYGATACMPSRRTLEPDDVT
jgi:hypothetical protein